MNASLPSAPASAPLRIAVMGAGGVGGYFGARLALAGHDVHFIARGAHLAAMRRGGLRIDSPRGAVTLADVNATEDPRPIGPVDLVLFGVKLWDTAQAAEAIRPLLGAGTAVISFQNGVVKDDILRAALGAAHVVGGVCYIAATIAEPGLIRHTGTLQKLVFGEYDGSVSPRVEAFRAACAGAAIDAEILADIRRALWEKFVFLVGLSATTATARAPIGVIRAHPQARAFLQDTMDEVARVAQAEGVPLPEGFVRDRLVFCDQLPPAMTSSMHQDLERGNRLEVAWLSGDVVARGARLGIPTPCNRAVFDLLSVHAQGRAG